MKTKRFIEKYGILALVIANLIAVFFNQSTYDDGDSILHYIQSKQSLNHPMYFMDHWAKPIFVLCSFLFSQVGFWGMKLFNSLCVILSLWYSQKILKQKELPYSYLVWIFGFFATHIFLVQSSGLTEPLFALLLIAGSYFYLKDATINSLVIWSFLPFIRSEGWVIGLVLIVMILWQKKWKQLPLILSGTIIYGIIGYFVYDDFLWMFHQNPYQGIEEKYGRGDFFHYFKQTPYLLGWPIAVLLIIGLLKNLIQIIRSKFQLSAYHFLVPGVFLAMIIAHSIFWHYGLFHSFGMQRVLLAVFPAMVLLAYDGIIQLRSLPVKLTHKRVVFRSFVILCILFPFSGNKAGFDIPQDFSLTSRQITVKKASDWFIKNHNSETTVSFAHYYFAETLNRNINNSKEVILLNSAIADGIPKGSILFWDDYFAESDQGVKLSDFDSSKFENLIEFETNQFGRYSKVIVFKKL